METIKLDLIPGKKMPSLHASQFDDGRAYHIDLTENRVPYVLDGTETISVIIRKCDNTLVSMDIANTFANKSYLEFEVTEQMTACSGFNYGEIILEKNGDRLGSLNFYLQVEAAPDENGITSTSEVLNLKRQVSELVAEELEDHGAEETGYDNTNSGLEATNVQEAIDELANKTPEDIYTKEESDEKFATKNALQTVANAIPTKTSELTNDSNFATMTEVSEALPEIATPIISELVPTVIGNDYYNKPQTNDAIFERVNDITVNKSNYAWELGSITSSGTKSSSTTTVRTPFIRLQKGTEMYVDPDYMYRAYRYTQPNESSFVEFYDYGYSSLHWITGPFVIPVEGYYILTVRKRDNSTIPSGNEQIVGNKLVTSENLSLNALKQHISMDIFAYNLTALDKYICDIAQLGGDVVLHCVTDIHGGYTDTYPVINYLARSGIADYFFELGDVIKSTFPTRNEAGEYLRSAYSRMDYGNKGAELVYLQGNHDTNPLSGTDTSKNITQEMFYGLSKARPKAFKQPTDKAYGYIDVEHAKVRLIFLNTSDIYSEVTGEALVSGKKTMVQQGQIDWLTGVALNLSDKTTPSDWSVIILTHDALSQVAGGMFGDILTAFKNGGSVSGSYPLTVDTYSYSIHVSCDYSGQGSGTVICEVNGHHHKDMIKELGSTGIMQVFIACEGDASACYDDNGTTVYYDREIGTTDEHLIDTLILDKANRKVYFKRFGVGSDREITY